MQNVIRRMSAAGGGGQIRVTVVLCYTVTSTTQHEHD